MAFVAGQTGEMATLETTRNCPVYEIKNLEVVSDLNNSKSFKFYIGHTSYHVWGDAAMYIEKKVQGLL